jgi:hypothetical protein
LAPPYKPSNVYLRQEAMPQSIRRVAVLPVAQNGVDPNQIAGVELLGPVWVAELGKRKLFEIIVVSAEELRILTGRASWAAEDELPQDFFSRLTGGTGCDAVLFASLTTYQPYPPLRVGWKARLVDCSQHQTWWSVDELFDAGDITVIAAAEAYARTELSLPDPLLADTGVLHSPGRFGRYTVGTIARTLPHR